MVRWIQREAARMDERIGYSNMYTFLIFLVDESSFFFFFFFFFFLFFF